MSISDNNSSIAFRPSTVTLEKYIETEPVLLNRKIYFIDPLTAIAAAGDVTQIKEFLNECHRKKGKIHKSDRPMRIIGDIANELGGVNIIGASIRGNHNNILRYDTSFELKNLDLCAVSGSGSQRFSSWLEEWDRSLSGWPSKNPYELIRGTAQGLSNYNFMREAMHADFGEDWGAFIEYGYYDFRIKRWTRGIDTLHIIALAFEDHYEHFSMGMYPRLIGYAPRPNRSYLRTFNINTGGINFEWTLNDLQYVENKGSNDASDFSWTKWRPKSATVTMIPPRGFALPYLTQTTDLKDSNKLIYKLTPHSLKIGIDNIFWDELSWKACRRWGVKYARSSMGRVY